MILKNSWRQAACLCLIGILLVLATGCTKHVVESRSQVELAPVELKPIHITIDVNVRVDRALDNFFAELDESKDEIRQERTGNRAATPANSNREQEVR
jgi:hypothetical protein